MQPPSDHGFDARWLLEEHPELLVINKPAGLSVLRDRSGAIDLWQQLRAVYGKLYQVHRLDKATSGVLLVARTQSLQSELTRHFAQRSARKTYLADVQGNLSLCGTGTIELPLRKGRKSRYRVAAQRESIRRSGDRWDVPESEDGVDACTRIRRIGFFEDRSRLLLQPRTGRTHQLRVHLAWIGHAILGDPLYGKQSEQEVLTGRNRPARMLLHAARLSIPGHGRWSAPLDEAWPAMADRTETRGSD